MSGTANSDDTKDVKVNINNSNSNSNNREQNDPPALTAEGTENEEESSTIPAPKSPEYNIAIHALLDAAHAMHGIRQEDYAAYHAYCTRRLSRLRHNAAVKKDLSFGGSSSTTTTSTTGGKKLARHAFRSKQVLVEDSVKHSHYLLVQLMSSERAWAHGMQLMQLSKKPPPPSKSSSSNHHPGTQRQHALRRLKKATQFSSLLHQMALVSANERTQMEAEAYHSWIMGNFALETNQWESAVKDFGRAAQLCRTLSIDEEDLEVRDYLTTRADTVIQPLLRYCQYELGGVTNVSETTPQATATATTTASTGTSKAAAAPSSAAEFGRVVEFRGQSITVEEKDLHVAFLKLSEHQEQQQKLQQQQQNHQQQQNSSENLPQQQQSHHHHNKQNDDVALLSAYDDAVTLIIGHLQKYNAMKAGPAVNAKRSSLEVLLGYIKYQKLCLSMKRSEKLIAELKQSMMTAASSEGDGGTKKRVEEMAHMYDALLQDARAVAELPGAPHADEEDEFLLQANANVLRIRALRSYYMGRMYGAHSKPAEAFTLLKHSTQLAAQAVEEMAACNDDMPHADEYIRDMMGLQDLVAGAKSQAQALVYLEQHGHTSSSYQQWSLLERLDDYNAGTSGRDSHLAHVVPKPIPIPCKPSFFDIAWNHIGQMPMDELADVIAAHKPQSKGIMSWFTRG